MPVKIKFDIRHLLRILTTILIIFGQYFQYRIGSWLFSNASQMIKKQVGKIKMMSRILEF